MKFRDKINDEAKLILDGYHYYLNEKMCKFDEIYDGDTTFNDVPKYKRKALAREADKSTLKDSLERYRKDGLLTNNETIDNEFDVIMRASAILKLCGYNKTAKELTKVGCYLRMSKDTKNADFVLQNIIDGAIKKNRSDAASGHRHHLHDEIVAIMKATWKENSSLSKKKMIAKLINRYEGRVDEGTVDSWIKKEKLLPPKPKKYIISELVIPPQYA